MDSVLITNVLAATVIAGTPLLLVALGELVCERSGVLNLGQEGMMLMGAVIGFMAAVTSGSLAIGVLAAALAPSSAAAMWARPSTVSTRSRFRCSLTSRYSAKYCSPKTYWFTHPW